MPVAALDKCPLNTFPHKDERVDNKRACLKRVAIGCLVAAVIFGVLAGVFMHKGNIAAFKNRTFCAIGLSNCALATIALISGTILLCQLSRDAEVVVKMAKPSSFDLEKSDSDTHEEVVSPESDQLDRDQTVAGEMDPSTMVQRLSVDEARNQMLNKNGLEIAALISKADSDAESFLQALTKKQVDLVVAAGKSMIIASKMPKRTNYTIDDKFSDLKWKNGKQFAEWVKQQGRQEQASLINFFYTRLSQPACEEAVSTTRKLFGQNSWGNRDTDYREAVRKMQQKSKPLSLLYQKAIDTTR